MCVGSERVGVPSWAQAAEERELLPGPAYSRVTGKPSGSAQGRTARLSLLFLSDPIPAPDPSCLTAAGEHPRAALA